MLTLYIVGAVWLACALFVFLVKWHDRSLSVPIKIIYILIGPITILKDLLETAYHVVKGSHHRVGK